MKKLAVWVDAPYQSDVLFDPLSPMNRDDCLAPFRLLKDTLLERNWECRTHDIYKAQRVIPDAVLFQEIPGPPLKSLLGDWSGKTRNLCLIMECEAVKPGNWELERHSQFDVLFTWSDRLVDNKRYFKINFSNVFPATILCDPAGKKKLCVMITAHKKSPHPLELYSERERSIRWFEQNHPEDFDLYGIGWDRRVFTGSLIVRALNRIPLLPALTAPVFPSYRGIIGQKYPVLGKYKFSICYENARDIPGYVTEKIFDSLFAGCIPVYWGAPDITGLVPEDCFIDRRRFKSHEDLYSYLKGMTAAGFTRRLDAINSFLASDMPEQFTHKFFAKTIAGAVDA